MFYELSNEQNRHLVDIRMLHEELEACRNKLSRGFAGSMRWVDRSGRRYLLKKEGRAEKSLGREGPDTQDVFNRFIEGRDRLRKKKPQLESRMDELARISRALRLNRLPQTPGKVLRHLGDANLLGGPLFVVGTTCLYLYESMAAVMLKSGALSTNDMDLLLDSRQGLFLAGAQHKQAGLVALLQRADKSFRRSDACPFRASNDEGFMVDFIRPMDILSPGDGDGDDIQVVEIEGLDWLLNAPKVDDLVIAQDGKPVRVWAPDPRVFALHKLWLSKRLDRPRGKRARDEAQAHISHELAQRVGMKMDSQELSALPAVLRDLAPLLNKGEAGAA